MVYFRGIISFPEATFLFFFLRWDEFQKIADLTVQYRTDTGKYVYVQTGNVVVAVVVNLGALHFCFVAQLVFTDTCFLDQLIQFDANCSVFFHSKCHLYVENGRTVPVDIDSVYKLDLKYKF